MVLMFQTVKEVATWYTKDLNTHDYKKLLKKFDTIAN